MDSLKHGVRSAGIARRREQDLDQVYQHLQQQQRYVQIVNDLALALLRTDSMDEILWLVAKSAIAQLNFEDCVIYLLDADGENLIQRAAHGPKNPAERDILDPIVVPLGQGIVGTVAATGVGEIVTDTRLDPRYILDDEMRLSEIAVPIGHDDQVIGVIDSEHPEAGFYTQEHLNILTTIASLASTRIATALAIERLHEAVQTLERTEAELRRSEQRYKALYNSHPSMFFTLGRDGAIRSVNQFAANQLGYHTDQLIGRPVNSVYQDVKPATVVRRLDRCLRQPGTVQRWESCLATANGEPVWVRESACAVELTDGEHDILMVSEDVTDVRRLSQELQFYASHDVLTGLSNRREFETHLQRALAEARQNSSEHALLYVDLDMFKIVNDACGHVAGDELLRQVSSLFRHKVRRSDVVARLGGDEFGVLMQGCSLDHALRAAEALRAAVEGFRFEWGNRVFSVGSSIGVCTIDRHSGSGTALLSMADSACYTAKQQGRNRVHVYSDSDEQAVQRTREAHWIERLQDALDGHRFRLLRQPIVAVADPGQRPAHWEFLLRMVGEDGRSLISPATFFPAAERYGLSLRVDRYVVSRVLEWLAEQPREVPLLAGLNISGFSVGDELLDYFIAELARTNAAASKVCIEITETATVANFAAARRFIGELRALGCRFALDDFGSGLSSFAYLKHLPVDFLKIDGAYVRDLPNDEVDLELVKAMNDIAHTMGMLTVAEFVESEAILSKLTEIGVDFSQGYHIGMPQPIGQDVDLQDLS